MSESSNEESRSTNLQIIINRIFHEDLMIALAAILAGSVILQLIIEFSPGMRAVFEYLNYFIIAAFVAEYVLKLYAAKSRVSFVTNPLHVLDLIIILIALFDFSKIGYFSFLPDQAQMSPILRLLRVLPRALLAFFVAGRTAERIRDQKDPPSLPAPGLQIAALDLKGSINRSYSKETSCSIMSDETPVWIDFQYIKEIDLNAIECTTKIPHDILETKLLKESFPRIDHIGDILTLFIWDSYIKPDCLSSKKLNIVTNNMLIIFNENKIITLSRGKSHLFDRISYELSNKISNRPLNKKEFTDIILYSLLRQKMVDYSDIVQRIEQKTIEFEEIQVDKTSSQFLEETFHFKKEILTISSNLRHFHNVLHQIIDKDNIRSFGIDNSNDFESLHSKAGYLYDTTQIIKESLVSLIELHTNTVSYDMNRVMKVIAVITCLAIIPATVGGLLGVNLDEGNFPIKLIEIFFIVFSSMLLGIYAFYKMDWLK